MVSALIDASDKVADYFWFTFSGDRGNTQRLLRQLAAWCGKRTGVWQPKDDIHTGLLQPEQAITRFEKIPLHGAWIVLDDCHKLDDRAILRLLRTLTDAWPQSKLILASEEKLPEASELGITHKLVHGFEPKESVEFVTRLGLDVSAALIEFAMLSVRVDGHPLMLRAAVGELPPQPSAAQVSEVAGRLPSVESVKGFLDSLSNQIFFKLIRSAEQRTWVGRLAVLTLSFTRSIAFKLAALEPPIQVTEAYWRYLRSLVLDQTGADHYSVPRLIRELATSEARTPDPKTILVASARYIFSTAVATRKVDFLDFHNAIFSLIIAGACEEAAMRFILSFPSFARVESFEPFELILLALNAPPIHAKLPDPGIRWLLLNSEVTLRLQDRAAAKHSQVASLLRRMRTLFHEEWTPEAWKLHCRAMCHVTVSFARMRRTASSVQLQIGRKQKFVASIHAALRLAILSDDQELILSLLHYYDQLHVLAKRPDIELIEKAILRVASQAPAISAEALITLYAQYVVSAGDTSLAVQVVQQHSADYLDKGLNDAYFACIHANATAILERFNQPHQARELIQSVMGTARGLELSGHCVARGELLIADTLWVEKNYSESSKHYERALGIEYADPFLPQYVTERLCDSWIHLGRYSEAVRLIGRTLRSRHATLPGDAKARFYARQAYALALDGAFRKAAVSCLALCRTAKSADSDALRCLAVMVAGWVLSRLDYSDPAIPRNDVPISESSTLSNEFAPEQVDALRQTDPFITKGIILVATVFELLDEPHDLRRSEFLFRQALGAVENAGDNHPHYLDASYILRLRIARLEIRRGRFSEAANSFKTALAGFGARMRRDKPDLVSDAPAVETLLNWVEPSVKGCTDAEVSRLFLSICGQFRDNPGVRAWVHYRESKIFFERYLVQAAKRGLLEAERLALEVGDKLLIARIIFDKLFNRVEQFYPFNRNAWLVDALGAAAVLASDEVYDDVCDSFANNVRTIPSHQMGPPFDELNTVVSRLEDCSKEQMFLVVAYAMWRAATKHSLLAGSVDTLESYLRQNAKFLAEDDFQ